MKYPIIEFGATMDNSGKGILIVGTALTVRACQAKPKSARQ
jgi:hypothetical protein